MLYCYTITPDIFAQSFDVAKCIEVATGSCYTVFMKHRIFFGIFIPSSARAKIDKYLSTHPLPGKLEQNEKLHITLIFLGEVDDDTLARLSQAGKRAAQIFHEPINIQAEGPHFIPSLEQPRYVWLSVLPNAELEKLKVALDEALLDLGVRCRQDFSQFRPHVNLSRIGSFERLSEEAPVFADELSLSFSAEEFCLVESRLLRQGAVYEVLDRYVLGTENEE